MGGGEDSRIPSILSEQFNITVRTYSFDPEEARKQIDSWIKELSPALLIGESLGATHALYFAGKYNLPCILVSPAINAPRYFVVLSLLCFIPGVGKYFCYKHKSRTERRQKIEADYKILKKWGIYKDYPYDKDRIPFLKAFFGKRDHYRKSGIVSIHKFRSLFGDFFQMYDGSHYMEEEYLHSLLDPAIRSIL